MKKNYSLLINRLFLLISFSLLTLLTQAQIPFVLRSGVNGVVNVVKSDGTNIYIGGNFSAVNGVACNSVAKWDGISWSPLGLGIEGLSPIVYDIALMGTDVYVGGYFTQAGGNSISNLAKWDGSNWSAVGSGISGSVQALEVLGTTLYAGGNFGTAGGISANMIARWDGSNWTALGTGLDHWVYDIVTDGTNLFVGGYFSNAGGSPASRVARWDGTSWSALGAGCNNTVYALALDGSNNLYAGGVFTSPGSYIAKWNGSAWSNPSSSTNSYIYSLASDGGSNIYAAGIFTSIGSGVSANRIARYNGTTWSALGTGLATGSSAMKCLAYAGGSLYAGGDFTSANGSTINRFARWDGTNFNKVGTDAASGNGLNSSVNAMAKIGNDVFVAGAVTQAGGLDGKAVYKWDGVSFSMVGNSFNADIHALVADVNGVLYAAGNFTDVGGDLAADYIVKWDGSAWVKLHTTPPNNALRSLMADGEDIYAGGYFTSVGGIGASYIAKYNGTSWQALGTGLPGSYPWAIAKDGLGNIYAGGSFSGYIRKWNGTTWSTMGAGPAGIVYSLAVDANNNVYAGQSNTSSLVQKWDGTTWSNFARTLSTSQCYSIVVDSRNRIYLGGTFTQIYTLSAGGTLIPAAGSAQWNGTTWSQTDNGFIGGAVKSLIINGTELIAGGDFHKSGNTISSRFASLTNTLLPISWVSFNAVKQNQDVLLSWTTTQSASSLNYIVQHSTDNINWNDLAIVPANVGGSNGNYRYVHENPTDNENFYRIKQLENTGSYNYSATKMIKFTKSIQVAVYPNPASEKLTISSSEKNTADNRISITDLMGRKVHEQSFLKGSKLLTLNVANWSKGIYYLSIRNDEGIQVFTKKVLIR